MMVVKKNCGLPKNYEYFGQRKEHGWGESYRVENNKQQNQKAKALFFISKNTL